MPISILGLSGSVRRHSTSTALLEAASGHLPQDCRLEIFPYTDVPLFNVDLGAPASVVRLKEAIGASSAVLLSCPEYNHSVPGVLKNALDWASRPAFHSVFAGKPCGILTLSSSFVGGARAQAHLQQILLSMRAPVYPTKEFLVGNAADRFTDGRLTDQSTERRLAPWLKGFVEWAVVQPSL